jgi:1-acyl-sn-glycerol-3-phosphate acyltransferase
MSDIGGPPRLRAAGEIYHNMDLEPNLGTAASALVRPAASRAAPTCRAVRRPPVRQGEPEVAVIQGAVGIGGTPRALGRFVLFTVGSWLVVALGIGAVASGFPRRWVSSGPHVARWARLVRRCLGVRVRTSGRLPEPGSLVVGNHQSYVDIATLGGLFPSIYAARHDMRRWPLLGALAASGATIFINRQNLRAGARGVAQVAAALAAGATVIAFPEGTTGSGDDLLPVRTGIFQAAVDARAPVVPAAIRYLELDGRPIAPRERRVVGWYGGEPFAGHVRRLLDHRSVGAEVTLLPAIRPPHADRRSLAAQVERVLRDALGYPPPSRSAVADESPTEGSV